MSSWAGCLLWVAGLSNHSAMVGELGAPWRHPGDILGLWHPISLSPSCVIRGGEGRWWVPWWGRAWPAEQQVKTWEAAVP